MGVLCNLVAQLQQQDGEAASRSFHSLSPLRLEAIRMIDSSTASSMAQAEAHNKLRKSMVASLDRVLARDEVSDSVRLTVIKVFAEMDKRGVESPGMPVSRSISLRGSLPPCHLVELSAPYCLYSPHCTHTDIHYTSHPPHCTPY